MFTNILMFFAALVNILTPAPLAQNSELPKTVSRVALVYASPESAAQTLTRARLAGVDRIVFDPTDDSLIVVATDSGKKAVLDLLSQIDRKTIVVKKYSVSFVDAKSVVSKLGLPIPGVERVTYDPTDNAVVARGTDKGLALFERSLRRLDRQVLIVKKFKLTHASARTVVERIQKPVPGIETLVYDPTDNSVIARGTEQGLSQIGKLVSGLDKK